MARELKGDRTSHRFRAIDWLRGLSVLFMVECHSLYFLRPDLERTPFWYKLQGINGLVSVAFLFAAGFSIALVVARAAGDAHARQRRSKRSLIRIGEVALLALYIGQVSHDYFSNPIWLLRPDILTCIVAGLVLIWAVVTACRGRNALAAGLLAGLWVCVLGGTLFTTTYRGDHLWIGLINNSTGAMFPLMPWTGYMLLGGILGVFSSHPTRARLALVFGVGIMTALGAMLALTPVGDALWRSLDGRGLSTYMVSNAFERIWKLGVICLVLMAIERLTTAVGAVPWTRVFRLLGSPLEYFSKMSLSAYFVHLTLLYGFWGIQFTQVWHRKSSWQQYFWRMPVLIGMTALVCYGLHLVRRRIEAVIRAKATPVAVVGARSV